LNLLPLVLSPGTGGEGGGEGGGRAKKEIPIQLKYLAISNGLGEGAIK
jgi:hypothetical protein